MAVIKPPETAPTTPLWGASFWFEKLWFKLDQLYKDLDGVWLLGDWLKWPVYFAAYYLQQFIYKIREADRWIGQTRLWVDKLYDGTQFRAILDDISTNLRWIRLDPLGWLHTQLRALSIDLLQIISSGSGWVRDKVLQTFPILNQIQFNTLSWLRGLIQSAFGAAFIFLINPRDTLRHWVTQLSPFLEGIIYGGLGYILNQFNSYTGWFNGFLSNPRETVITWIKQYNSQLNELIFDPRQWLVRRLAGFFGISDYEVNNLYALLGIVVLRKLNEQARNYRNEVRDLTCNIIKIFL